MRPEFTSRQLGKPQTLAADHIYITVPLTGSGTPDRIVHDAIEKYAQTAIEAISPAQEQVANILAAGQDPWVTPRYAQDSLRKKLKVIGLEMHLPSVPPPPIMGV